MTYCHEMRDTKNAVRERVNILLSLCQVPDSVAVLPECVGIFQALVPSKAANSLLTILHICHADHSVCALAHLYNSGILVRLTAGCPVSPKHNIPHLHIPPICSTYFA
jgi:hypothetical protein